LSGVCEGLGLRLLVLKGWEVKNEQERELTFIEKIRGLNENLFRLVEAYVDGVYTAMKVME